MKTKTYLQTGLFICCFFLSTNYVIPSEFHQSNYKQNLVEDCSQYESAVYDYLTELEYTVLSIKFIDCGTAEVVTSYSYLTLVFLRDGIVTGHEDMAG